MAASRMPQNSTSASFAFPSSFSSALLRNSNLGTHRLCERVPPRTQRLPHLHNTPQKDTASDHVSF